MKLVPFAFSFLILLHPFQSTTPVDEPPIPIIFFQHQNPDSLSIPAKEFYQCDSSITVLSQRIDSLNQHLEAQNFYISTLRTIVIAFIVITTVVLSIISTSLQKMKKQLLTQQPPPASPVPTVEAIINQPEPQPNEQLQQQPERSTPKRRPRKKTT